MGNGFLKIIVTGSSGRVGRAIFGALALEREVVGIDRTPFSTSHIIADFTDRAVLDRALEGADAVVHAAALHAPHVGVAEDREFERINVEGTRVLAEAARAHGVRHIVFTSTTALYAHAIAQGKCTWVDETTPPQPRSIYHRTKLAAERVLADAADTELRVTALRMSRCFPETADLMALYRLHRGVDVRDVADAHARALVRGGAPFACYVISGAPPFTATDCDALAEDAPAVLQKRAPDLVDAFRARGWGLPRTIDRVYAPAAAERALGWRARYGFQEVLFQLDRRSLEVLPAGASAAGRAE